MGIHPTAVVGPKAELGTGVRIGPYSVIGDHVQIGRDTIIGPHVVIEGHTTIGERNEIWQFASIGTPPHDIGYRGEDTRVVMGNGNIVREFVTINRATTKEDRATVIGNDGFFMAYAHVAHDCKLGNGIIMSNAATLGGHTLVGDHANFGGMVAVHQFVRIGAYAFLGAKSGIDRDVPPFMITAGPRAKLYGINRKGLSRMGLPQTTIEGLNKAYRIIWREGGRIADGIQRVRKEIDSTPELETLIEFLEGETRRGILR